MKTAYIYVRIASAHQVDQFSVINQERICLEYAKAQGYKVREVFIDQGKDVNYSKRPELKRMFEAIVTDPPTAVICLSVDRIFRNFHDFCGTRNKLKKQGVRLLFVHDGGERTSGLVDNFLAAIAQYESEVAS